MFEYEFIGREKEFVQNVLDAAEAFGYGNMIAHLKREWALKLIKQGISKEAALAATNVSAYPLPE